MTQTKAYALVGSAIVAAIGINMWAVGAFGKSAPLESPLIRALGDPLMPPVTDAAPVVLFPEYPGERNARSRLDLRHAPTFTGFAAYLRARVSTACLPAPLKAALAKVQEACEGFEVTSANRPGARTVTGRTSLHSTCSAADFKVRVWACAFKVFASLRWRGSLSIDPTTVRCGGAPCPHIHAGWKPGSGEHGRRFAHHSTKVQVAKAKRSKARYAKHYRARVQVAYAVERGQ